MKVISKGATSPTIEVQQGETVFTVGQQVAVEGRGPYTIWNFGNQGSCWTATVAPLGGTMSSRIPVQQLSPWPTLART